VAWACPFFFSTCSSNKSDTTVSEQLRSVFEPPWCVEVGKNRRCANDPDAWKLTSGFDNGIFVGGRAELFLRYPNLLFGGVVANP
jgi:hypothetical protein